MLLNYVSNSDYSVERRVVWLIQTQVAILLIQINICYGVETLTNQKKNEGGKKWLT